MKKEELKKIKGLLYGISLGITSISITGCTPDKPEKILGYLKVGQYKEKNVGLIKNGEEFIPYYKYDQSYIDVKRGYYSAQTGEYIGEMEKENIKLDDIIYAKEQIIPFIACNPNAEYNYEAISSFTEETYKNLADSYFETHAFKFRIYEIKNLTTNNITYVIGRKVSGTDIFNFETYKLEDYTGYAITEVEMTYEKESYYYNEILNLISEYRESINSLSLDKK